ncbi:hypothetical protein CK203_040218 [Vitis vinifera]|uniref:Retrotransposon Copia-like N-terminal domain-containing protein n=1 Tax=Vitis vinifera TaxID=29760 RepID=A0A438HXD2_VITVI|nr:hypothetical protein CK203_040218 [Vitis vinifera]
MRVSEIHSSMGPVGAFDNSPLHLIVEKLNGKNYREWAQAIKLVIDGKGKLRFLTDETRRPPPTDVAASQKWRLTCSPNGKGRVGCDTGNVSNAENASQIFEIKTRLWQMKQGDREVTEYYTEMLEEDGEREGVRVPSRLNRKLDDLRSRVLSFRSLPPSEKSSPRCDDRKTEGE